MSTDATASTIPQLDYGRAAPRWKKRIRRGMLLALVMIAALVGWRWGPAAWGRMSTLYWQRQCLKYVAPPDRVVYEEDSELAARLLKQNPEYATYMLTRTLGPSRDSAATTAA